MINKIGNWVFGSFFRTIGRLLVFVLLGVIIAHLVDFSDIISSFRITDLFFEKVKATTTDFSSFWQSNMYNESGTQLNYNVFGYLNSCATSQSSSGAGACTTFFNSSASTSGGGISIPNDFDTISFRVMMRTPTSMVNGFSGGFSFTTLNNWGGGTACEIISDSWIQTSDSQDLRKIWVIKCPLINGSSSISGLVFYYNGSDITRYGLEISGDYLLSKSSSFKDNQIISAINTETQAINSQTQQQQQQHQEIMDDNTTQANTEGQDFINNFSNNSHGLTGIITAPLNAIQSLSSATCSPLVLPLPFMTNKSLTLPCMNSIYTQYFGAFYTMYQGIILALISYWVCVRLFTLVKGFKDPEDDKIEVMDL